MFNTFVIKNMFIYLKKYVIIAFITNNSYKNMDNKIIIGKNMDNKISFYKKDLIFAGCLFSFLALTTAFFIAGVAYSSSVEFAQAASLDISELLENQGNLFFVGIGFATTAAAFSLAYWLGCYGGKEL